MPEDTIDPLINTPARSRSRYRDIRKMQASSCEHHQNEFCSLVQPATSLSAQEARRFKHQGKTYSSVDTGRSVDGRHRPLETRQSQFDTRTNVQPHEHSPCDQLEAPPNLPDDILAKDILSPSPSSTTCRSTTPERHPSYYEKAHVQRNGSHSQRLTPQPLQRRDMPMSATTYHPHPVARSTTSKIAFDAPVSAINGGQRSVTVKCGRLNLSIPVTPSTTARDVIAEIAARTTLPGDAKMCIVSESFHSLGLERALRQYEHVRDVMNSWAADDENHLIITTSNRTDIASQMHLSSVPSSRPCDIPILLTHSNRPNKWDKRWITLRSDGQIIISKQGYKTDSQQSCANNCRSRPSVDLCHLSDSDIYVLTTSQRMRINPPGNYCFAIKSQQKSTMFLSTERFIHFFSTNDQDIGDLWFRSCHGWRSWYLVNGAICNPVESGAALTSPRDQSHAKSDSSHKSTISSPKKITVNIPASSFSSVSLSPSVS